MEDMMFNWFILGIIGVLSYNLRQICSSLFSSILSKFVYSLRITSRYKIETISKYLKDNNLSKHFTENGLVITNTLICKDKFYVYVVPTMTDGQIIIYLYSLQNLEKFMDFINELKTENIKSLIFINNKMYRKEIMRRDIDKIYLPLKFKNSIISCVDKFNKSEKYYERQSLIYKLVIFLHGLPGTGKSSMIHGIGSRYNEILYLPNNLESLHKNIGSLLSKDSLIGEFKKID